MTTQRSLNAVCSNCLGPCSAAGRASASGKRYCKAPACRRARDRERSQTVRGARPDRPAPETCSGCGQSMPTRNWRSGDELGRWCQKAACLRKRRTIENITANETDLARKVERLEVTAEFLGDVVMADSEDYLGSNRVVCHTCGLTSAIKGWVHPTESMSPCEGTLDGYPIRNYGSRGAAGGWPFRRQYLSADELAAAYGD